MLCCFVGETTQLNEPKPGGSSGGSGAGEEGQGGAAREKVDPNSEAPLADRTGYYAGMGALIGAVAGWASQFF